MRYRRFARSMDRLLAAAPVERAGPEDRYLVLAGLRLGDRGPRDDSARISNLLEAALVRYLDRGHTLVLAGDIEDLRSCWYKDIRRAWLRFYDLLDAFAGAGRLRRILGERDLGLLRKREYPYELLHGLVIEGLGPRVAVVHGHQASRSYAGRDYLDFVASYTARPRLPDDEGDLRDPGRAARAEARLQRYASRRGLLLLSGHGERALFESRGKLEDLRHDVEAALRERLLSKEADPGLVERLIGLYRREEAARERERRRLALLDQCASPAPCLFSPGRADPSRGFGAIELEAGKIRLVRWSRSGAAGPGLEARALSKESLAEGAGDRHLLRESSLAALGELLELLRPEAGKARRRG